LPQHNKTQHHIIITKEKVKSRGPDWPVVHLRAGQGVFRQEITSSGQSDMNKQPHWPIPTLSLPIKQQRQDHMIITTTNQLINQSSKCRNSHDASALFKFIRGIYFLFCISFTPDPPCFCSFFAKGWVLVCEPEIAELNENYVMVFRPKTSEEASQEMASAVGSGWADKPVPAAAPQAP
jgi:hypothetical protein